MAKIEEKLNAKGKLKRFLEGVAAIGGVAVGIIVFGSITSDQSIPIEDTMRAIMFFGGGGLIALGLSKTIKPKYGVEAELKYSQRRVRKQ